ATPNAPASRGALGSLAGARHAPRSVSGSDGGGVHGRGRCDMGGETAVGAPGDRGAYHARARQRAQRSEPIPGQRPTPFARALTLNPPRSAGENRPAAEALRPPAHASP